VLPERHGERYSAGTTEGCCVAAALARVSDVLLTFGFSLCASFSKLCNLFGCKAPLVPPGPALPPAAGRIVLSVVTI